MCGGSSGAAMAAALEAAKSLGKGQRCVVVLPDSSRNYMSKFLDDEWLVAHNIEPPSLLTKGATEWWADRCDAAPVYNPNTYVDCAHAAPRLL